MSPNKTTKPSFAEPVAPQGNVVPAGIGATAPMGAGDIQTQINQLRELLYTLIATHRHDGGMSTRVDLDTDIIGLFEVVSSVPTGTPKGLYDQIKIYSSGGTRRLYCYEYVSQSWRYTALT